MPHSHFSNRQRTIFGLTLLLLLTIVGMMAYWVDNLLREGSIETNQAYLKVAVEDRHVVIEQFLNERLNMLKVLTRSAYDEHDYGPRHAQALLNELATTYADYLSFSVYTREGQLLGLAGEDTIDSSDVTSQEWFTVTLTRGEFVSPLYLGSRKIPTLAMSVLAITPAGAHVVRATLNLATLNTHLSEMTAGESGGTYMVNPITGSYLSRPYYGAKPLLEHSPRFNWGEKHFHVDYEEHGIEEVDAKIATRADGTEVMEAYCCIRDGTWLVVVERELEEVLDLHRALRQQLGMTLGFTLLLLIAITGIAFRLGRR